MTIEFVLHNQIRLALHTLRDGVGRSLLLLHGLGEASPTTAPGYADGWPGPVLALDFTGHGASTVPTGGGYTSEILLADADIVLTQVGEATIVGRGLGAYVALLLAGVRADRVHGVVLCDGPGLSGGASVPTSLPVIALPPAESAPDPYALVELGRDLRPPDYAAAFARMAIAGSALDDPIAVVATFRPLWLQAVVNEHGVVERPTVAAALRSYH